MTAKKQRRPARAKAKARKPATIIGEVLRWVRREIARIDEEAAAKRRRLTRTVATSTDFAERRAALAELRKDFGDPPPDDAPAASAPRPLVTAAEIEAARVEHIALVAWANAHRMPGIH